MRRIARLRLVMSDTAEISMSLVPAFTFLVCSIRSSTSTETSRTPLEIIKSSMQRNADEKLVMERKGFSCGPCLSRFAESMTGCLTPVLLQPINTMAVNRAAMPVVAMRCRVAVFMTVFFPSLFAFVVGVDHVARDHHYDLFRRAARFGANRVADVHAAATARLVLRIRRAGVDALIHGCLLGLVLGHLGPQQVVHVADFGFHRLCVGHHRLTHRTRRR